MRDTASRSPRRNGRRNRRLAALAIPAAVATGLAIIPAVNAQNAEESPGSSLSSLGSSNGGGSSLSDSFAPGEPPARTPIDTTYPEVDGLPAGVTIDRVEWLSPRRIAIFINSAAMPDEPIQVQMLLARDWHMNTDQDFPELWALDGLRAREDESGWTIETNIEQQYADKNVNVILPVGGESSFYSDWQQPDNGKHYMWETFLTQELVPILDNGFRSNQNRAIVGLSMGGTAAVNLAERNPQLFNFVGSFSGYLDTTSDGMPTAITAAMLDAGQYDATKMWGPAGSQDWIDHDPKFGIENLGDMTVYVSAGSGQDDFGLEDSVANGPANAAGVGLEVLARMTSQTFIDYAENEDVTIESRFRPSGVHSWEYWQFELNEAFPYIADALELPEEDRTSNCAPVGAIADAVSGGVVGECVNNEYDVEDGKAQDFRNGSAYWTPETGAHALFGAINTHYHSQGAASGWLGFPTTGEQTTPDGSGRFVHFENGSIYWTPSTGAHAIPGDMFQYWGENGYENSDVGYPVAAATPIDDGYVQEFQNGFVTRNPDGENHFILHGAIAEKYGELDTANSELGYPTSNEYPVEGGFFQEFEYGNIYWSPSTGGHYILYGDVFDHWGAAGFEQGEFGFPTADYASIPAGGVRAEFQNGTIEQINGTIREELN